MSSPASTLRPDSHPPPAPAKPAPAWDGPDDPLNPRNWPYRRKWAATAVVSAYTLITPLSSAMVAPATPALGAELRIASPVVRALVVSIFVLAFAFGPLVLGPLSEVYGRARVLQASNLFFLVFNLACGFARSAPQLLAFRLLAGLGGSAPLAIGGAVLGDCWAPEERGHAVGIYSLAPILGPVLGPLAGAWIAQAADWRWVFWSTSAACAAVQAAGLVLLRETYAPVLLARKAGGAPAARDLRALRRVLAAALARPFAMFAREPIIQALGVYMAFIYGKHPRVRRLFYLMVTTVPGVYQGTYAQRPGVAGLHYLALGVGLTTASQINAHVMDRIYTRYAARHGGQGRPEFRLPSMVPGAALLPAGLLLFGWTARADVPWAVPDTGLALIGAGIILVFQTVQSYTIDAFPLHAASALAAVACLRALAGFAFPLFAPAMFAALGHGGGGSLLAALAAVLGGPVPWVLWYWGERMRGRSRYAGRGGG